MAKVKFEVIVGEGKTQPWTGILNQKQADLWEKKHKPFWEARGRKFIKVIVG